MNKEIKEPNWLDNSFSKNSFRTVALSRCDSGTFILLATWALILRVSHWQWSLTGGKRAIDNSTLIGWDFIRAKASGWLCACVSVCIKQRKIENELRSKRTINLCAYSFMCIPLLVHLGVLISRFRIWKYGPAPTLEQ